VILDHVFPREVCTNPLSENSRGREALSIIVYILGGRKKGRGYRCENREVGFSDEPLRNRKRDGSPDHAAKNLRPGRSRGMGVIITKQKQGVPGASPTMH